VQTYENVKNLGAGVLQHWLRNNLRRLHRRRLLRPKVSRA
jgi:hypothetical protein